MADQKISDRTTVIPPLLGSEYIPYIIGIAEGKCTSQDIADLADLGYTAENIANKSTNVTTDGASDTKYPSVKSVKTYVDNALIKVKVSLSSAEILALFSSPKTLVAVPGAGKFIDVIGVMYYVHFNTVAYATQTDLRLSVGGLTIDTTSDTPLAAVANAMEKRTTAPYTIADTNINGALTLSVPTANPTAGDGTLDVYISYQITTV